MKGAPDTIKDALAPACIEGWEAINEELLEKLIKSMPRRIKAVIKAKGSYTHY